MKRIFFAATVITLMTVSSYGQTQSQQPSISPCSLTVSQSPLIRGVKLGMKLEDVLAMFPGSAEKDEIKLALEKADGYPNFGVASIFINVWQYPTTKSRFDGIADYRLVSLDGRIAQYEVEYDGMPDGPDWRRVDDFIAKMAETFHLPTARDWAVDKNASYQKTLKCDGFQLRASILNLRGSFTVSTADLPYITQEKRRVALEEKVRSAFRP